MPYNDAAWTKMSFSEAVGEELRDEIEFSDQYEPVIPLPRTYESGKGNLPHSTAPTRPRISGRRTMAPGNPSAETGNDVTDEFIYEKKKKKKKKILELKAIPESDYSPSMRWSLCSTSSVIVVAVFAVTVALVYFKTVNTLQSQVDWLNDDVQKHKEELKKMQTIIYDYLRHDGGQETPIKPDTEPDTETGRDIDDIQKKINSNTKEMKSDIGNLQTELLTIKSGMEQVNLEINNTEKYCTNAVDILDNTIRQNIDTITSMFNANISNVNSAQEGIGQRTDDIEVAHDELEKKVLLIWNLSDEQQELLTEKIAPNTFNKEAISTAFIVIFVMQLGAMAAIYVICKGQGQGHGVGQGHGRRDREYGMRNNTRRDAHNSAERLNPILNQIPCDAPLERRLCVIHLEGATMELHKRIVGTVLNGMATPQPGITDLHVSSNEDILKIPPATVNILFIHFHDRHVILEQPLLGLSDQNITTYRAVKQMGGRLAIVYVNDPGSRRLGEIYLYNREIPVREKAELQELCDLDCFYSTYDRLTPQQLTSLRRFIAKFLERH